MRPPLKDSYDVVVVGSGPAGATVARELSKGGGGPDVLLMEKGKNHRLLGNHLAAFAIADRRLLFRKSGGLRVVRGITLGGSSVITCGAAVRPPGELFESAGVDIERELDEAERDLGVGKMPDRLIGRGSRAILRAAADLGYDWDRLPKFIDPEKCVPKCSACMLGCRRGAKWTSRRFVEEAAGRGADVVTGADVEAVIVEGGAAAGVRGSIGGRRFEVRAKAVVVSAGGLGTPVILRRSGVGEAGREFFCDPFICTYGFNREAGMARDMPVVVGSMQFYESDGFVLSPVIDTFGSFLFAALDMGPAHLLRAAAYGKLMGIMTKVKDGLDGEISLDGAFSKDLKNERSKFEAGEKVCAEILIEAGCDPKTIFSTPPRGAHPGGTCGVGRVVDENFETRVKNLYACDASVIPASPGLPLVLTCVALGKKLSKKLSGKF